MNCYHTCSGRLTFGLCLFILFSISDKVIAMISKGHSYGEWY